MTPQRSNPKLWRKQQQQTPTYFPCLLYQHPCQAPQRISSVFLTAVGVLCLLHFVIPWDSFLFHHDTASSSLLLWRVKSLQNHTITEAAVVAENRNLSSVQQMNNSPQQRLWLVTCETRLRGTEDLSLWMFSAHLVQKLATKIMDAKRNPIEVHVANLCHGKKWTAWIMKFHVMKEFVERLVEAESVTSSHGGGNNNNNNNNNDLVLFADSDSIFNPYAVSAQEVVQRFVNLTTTTTTSSTTSNTDENGKIVISSEPNVFLGNYVRLKQKVVQSLYPNSRRSSCPQFVNSGQYMGTAKALLKMLTTALSMTNISGARGNPKSDQARLSHWYAQHPEEAVLDTRAVLFRNLMYGVIAGNSNPAHNTVPWTCGADAYRKCGTFAHPYLGIFNDTTHSIQMEPFVPGCQNQLAHSHPFSIHGAGPRFVKQFYRQMARKLRQANCRIDPDMATDRYCIQHQHT